MTDTKDPRLARTGVIGAAVVALCCAVPVLVLLFGTVALSALLGWIDYVLWPALAVLVALLAYALWRRRNRRF